MTQLLYCTQSSVSLILAECTYLQNQIMFFVLIAGETTARSQTLLGIKLMSNYLVDEAMDKFDEAIELDSLMGMPKIMKAYLLL